MHIPQIEPVTGLSRDYRTIFAKLTNGPVILAQRSKPAAILLSINEYETTMERLRYLEGLLAAKRNLARIDAGEPTVSHDELKRLMLEKQAVSHVGT